MCIRDRLIYTPPINMTKWYKLIFLVMSISRLLLDISLWDAIYARYMKITCYISHQSCDKSHQPCDISPDIWPISPDIWHIFRDFTWCSRPYTQLYMYNHRGWDLCPTGEPQTRFRRCVPVTYTICMHDTEINALAPRGYSACICAVWSNFHANLRRQRCYCNYPPR